MERFKIQDNRNGTFSVLDDRTGKLVFENETSTIADNVCFRLNHPDHPYLDGHPSECDEVADAIGKRLEQKELEKVLFYDPYPTEDNSTCNGLD